ERTYKCDCGYVEDRDFNASLNLRDAKIYRIA
ncbi:zinc ribbon domain-containing protein, partial [Floccifex sp.]